MLINSYWVRVQWAATFCGGLAILLHSPATARCDDPFYMKAEDVLKNWSEKTGGKAREKIKNRVMNGTTEVPLLHIKGPVTVYASAPANKYEVWELSAGHAFERGCNGVYAWNVSGNNEPTALTGPQKAVALREAVFNLELCWQEHYRSVETTAIKRLKRLAIGDELATERTCFELKMTPRDEGADPEMWYIDTENFQRLATITKVKVGDNVLDRTTLYADYRPVDGVLEPFLICEQIDVQRQIVVFKSIQHNVRMSKYRFEVPESVKAKPKDDTSDKGGATSATAAKPAGEKPAPTGQTPGDKPNEQRGG